jgi:hypothetical protein
MTHLSIVVFSIFLNQQAEAGQVNYIGQDEEGHPCKLTVSEATYRRSEQWLTYRLQTELGVVDTYLEMPVASTPTGRGECSVVAGTNPDTVIVKNRQIEQRVRMVEDDQNWIEGSYFRFSDDKYSALTNVEFRVGHRAPTGLWACSAYRQNRLQARFVCSNLRR